MRLVVRIIGYEVFSIGTEEQPFTVVRDGGWLTELDEEQLELEGASFGFARD